MSPDRIPDREVPDELERYIVMLEQRVNGIAAAEGIKPSVWAEFMQKLRALRDHSPVTYAHSLRVGVYAHTIAKSEGRADLRFPLFAGCGHDIGKVHIDKSVLEVEGEFTEDHRRIMNTHARLGFEALKTTNLYTAFIAGLHHKLQPHGYGIDLNSDTPVPLQGGPMGKILSMAKLIELVDFFDALTTRKNERGLTTDFGNQEQQKAVLLRHFPDFAERIRLLFSNKIVQDQQ